MATMAENSISTPIESSYNEVSGKSINAASQEAINAMRDSVSSNKLHQSTGNESSKNILASSHNAHVRRIIAEDPDWNLAPVEKLTALCIKVIVEKFKGIQLVFNITIDMPIIDGIPAKYRPSVLLGISTDLPLTITAPLIPDEQYWKKCASEKFINCDPSRHNDSWKQLYMEKYAQYLIEAYVPNNRTREGGKPGIAESKPLLVPSLGKTAFSASKAIGNTPITDTVAFQQVLELASPFIRALFIDQLRVHEQSEGVVVKTTDAPPNHIDCKMIFGILYNLESISLYYG
jgi:hypothetical protein